MHMHSHCLLLRNQLLLPPHLCSCLDSHLEFPPNLCFTCLNGHPEVTARFHYPSKIHQQISLSDLPSFSKSSCHQLFCVLAFQLGCMKLEGKSKTLLVTAQWCGGTSMDQKCSRPKLDSALSLASMLTLGKLFDLRPSFFFTCLKLIHSITCLKGCYKDQPKYWCERTLYP